MPDIDAGNGGHTAPPMRAVADVYPRTVICVSWPAAYSELMLSGFLETNRELLLTRARSLVEKRHALQPNMLEIGGGLPAFFEQLLTALQRATRATGGDHAELSRTAVRHGHALFEKGVTVAHVVRDYGALCQVITGLAVELNAEVPAAEFQILNLCLDEAIAAAVTEFASQRERVIDTRGTERLGMLAHELRNHLNTAMLAFTSIRSGVVAVGGSTGGILERSLTSLQTLIDRSFADVRLEAGLESSERIMVSEMMGEIEIGAAMSAGARRISLLVESVDDSVLVQADRQILTAVITNLLQNAFKFSPVGSKVSLRASSSDTRVCFDVEDQCGGLPPGKNDILLQPFVQRGDDRTGLGLGLAICVKSMPSMGGELRHRDLPGQGCVFTVDLPRQLAGSIG